jgi:hypothetical protein
MRLDRPLGLHEVEVARLSALPIGRLSVRG